MKEELKRRAENLKIGLVLSRDQDRSQRRAAFFKAVKDAQSKRKY